MLSNRQLSQSYDDVMDRKIKMLQLASEGDPSLSTIPGLPSTKRQTTRSTPTPDTFRLNTPQFSDRSPQQFSSPRKELSAKLKSITNDIEQSIRHVSFETKPKFTITYDSQRLQEYCTNDQPVTQDHLQQVLVNLHVPLTELAPLWRIMTVLTYGQLTDTHTIPPNEFANLMQVVFDALRASSGGDNSNPELQRYIEEKCQQSTGKKFFRSMTTFNRYLFDSQLPSFDRIIANLRHALINEGRSNDVYEIRQRSSSNQPTFLDSLQFSDILHQTHNSGIQRSLLLYEHAKKLNAKQSNMTVVKAKSELAGCTFTPAVLKHKSSARGPVFDRLNKPHRRPAPAPVREDLSNCTFKPAINSKKVQPQQSAVVGIPGVESQLKRWEAARQDRERVKTFYDQQQDRLHQQHIHFDKAQPFQLSETNRRQNEPVIYLDITVSKGRVGRLGVRKGDNVDQLVRTFSKTYTLGVEAQDKLKDLLEQVLTRFYGNTSKEN